MLALSLIALVVSAPGARKCPNPPAEMPGYEWREPVVVVDGAIVRTEGKKLGLQPEAVASIEITCWNPATNSFQRDGIPVIRVLTKALIESTKAPLLRLIEAQEAFRARHERFATELKALEPFGLAADVRLEFETTDTGWTAGTPSDEVAYRCSANENTAATAGDDGRPQPACESVDTLALRSLRAHYESGR